ncbi:hypothetical protein JCM8547_006291 [Rhodosporidiobolus lusitaniae]
MPSSHTTVTIVRHGETDWNRIGLIQGHEDVSLNEQGEAQARVAGEWFAREGWNWDAAYASDLSRASKTASIILSHQPEERRVPLQQDERIRERHLGNLQGKRRGDPGTDPRTAEPVGALRGRLWSFFNSLFPSSSPSSSPSSPLSASSSSSDAPSPVRQILFVSHGAAIREFVRSILEDRVERNQGKDGWTWELALPKEEEEALKSGSKRIDNCSRTVIEVEEQGEAGASTRFHACLTLYADDSHFAESSRAPSPRANADVVE